ncbi:hypothetical protein [Streptomyces sp. NPDC056796]|uniref:hypothetical protein n=1 Tax=unclassified Streptomyces TaxID=2593676 RepID=UPI00367D7ABF
MTDWTDHAFPDHEVNLVFVRGTSPGALAEELRGLLREPLVCGEGDGWAWAVHDMVNPEADDFDPVDYRGLSRDGGEAVVFVTEPCSAKAHGPDFSYYRDGRTILHFSFEDIGLRVGENPDHLSAELLAANLIGPGSECGWEEGEGHDCSEHHPDDEIRLVRVMADFFRLPSPPLSREVAAR